MRRRLVYGVLVLVWAIIMCFPILSFFVATRGEIKIGHAESNQLRLFLVQEDRLQGLGFEWTRPAKENHRCYISTVNYLLWTGKGENTIYCQCFDAVTGFIDAVSSCQEN